MTKRTKAGGREAGEAAAGKAAENEKIVQAEPVEGDRAAAKSADREAEDAAVLAETGPEPSPEPSSETPAESVGEGDPQADALQAEALQVEAENATDSAMSDAAQAEDVAGAAEASDGEASDLKEEQGGSDEPPKEEPQIAAGSGSGGGSGGGLGAALYGLIGAVLGGGLVLLGGEMLRPETLPIDEIATKQAVRTQLDAELAKLSGALESRLAEGSTQIGDVSARLTDLDAREAGAQARVDQAAEARAERIAALEQTLREEIAIERSRLTRLNDELAERERQRVEAVKAIREQVSALAAAVAATPSGGVVAEGGSATDVAGSSGASAAATTRLALMEGGLRRLEARVNGLSADALPTPDLTRIDKLEVAARSAAEARDALSARLDHVERSARSVAAGGAAIGVAFAALSDAATGAAPYKEPLALVKELSPPGVKYGETLEASAAQGLPSYVSLADWLEDASWQALNASAKARLRSGEGGVLDRLSGLFTFRPDVAPGDESDAEAVLLDRARRRIGERDAAGALEEIAKLPEAAQAALADWSAEAGRRAQAEADLASLRGQLLGGSAPAGASSGEAGR